MIVSALLCGCGGGGDAGTSVFHQTTTSSGSTSSSSSSTATDQTAAVTTTSSTDASVAPGLYAGTISGSQVATAGYSLILEDGSFWGIYGNPAGSSLVVSGFFTGDGTVSGGTLTSNDAEDYDIHFSSAQSAVVSANYSNGSLASTATFKGGTVISGTASAYPGWNYDTAASLADIAGTVNFTDFIGETGYAIINADGTFVANDGGCAATGAIVPRPSGKNVFNVTVSFGGSPCAVRNGTATGIALLAPLAGGTQKQFLMAITTPGRAAGLLLFGVK